jgi:hypothetical protein
MYYLIILYFILLFVAAFAYSIYHQKEDEDQNKIAPDVESWDDEDDYDSDEIDDEDDSDYDEYQEGSERETDYWYYYNQDSEN